MDTSEKYIKMCEKAEEIQKQRKRIWQWDDLYIELVGKNHSLSVATYAIDGQLKKYKNEVWLPRQDQLQEMIDWSSYGYPISVQCYKIDTFYRTLNYFPNSMEQLWFAFVMKEKYGKIWDDEKEEWYAISV